MVDFAYSYHMVCSSWGSPGKSTGVVCHFLQWTLFCHNSLHITCLSWVALHGMAHSFIELCKPLCPGRVGQEAAVKTGHRTTDGFRTGKGAQQGCMLPPCLLNLSAEHIMGNARLNKAQAQINIAGRNTSSLRYADGNTLMAGKRGWKRRVKKLAWNSAFKKLRSWHPFPSVHANRRGKSGSSDRLYFLGLQNHHRW